VIFIEVSVKPFVYDVIGRGDTNCRHQSEGDVTQQEVGAKPSQKIGEYASRHDKHVFGGVVEASDGNVVMNTAGVLDSAAIRHSRFGSGII